MLHAWQFGDAPSSITVWVTHTTWVVVGNDVMASDDDVTLSTLARCRQIIYGRVEQVAVRRAGRLRYSRHLSYVSCRSSLSKVHAVVTHSVNGVFSGDSGSFFS